MEEELNLRIKWGGSLEWFTSADRQARLAEQIDEQALWGEPARIVSRAELQQLEPNVNFGKANTAALSANDAAVDPVEATQALVNAAMQLGARVQTQCQVNSIASTPAGQVELQTDCGNVQVDKFVLATGADQHATQTLASIDLPQRSTPGVIVVTQPQPQLLGRIIVAPGVHIHQRLDGRVVLGEQEGAPNNQAHGQRLQQRPTRFPDKSLANQHARRILTTAREFVPKLKINQVQEVLIGWRPLPSDGHPVLGTSPYNPKAYLAIMHSGVTLAPVVGELVAKEIAEEQDLEMLAPYRPKRFVTQDSSSALLIQNHPTS